LTKGSYIAAMPVRVISPFSASKMLASYQAAVKAFL